MMNVQGDGNFVANLAKRITSAMDVDSMYHYLYCFAIIKQLKFNIHFTKSTFISEILVRQLAQIDRRVFNIFLHSFLYYSIYRFLYRRARRFSVFVEFSVLLLLLLFLLLIESCPVFYPACL